LEDWGTSFWKTQKKKVTKKKGTAGQSEEISTTGQRKKSSAAQEASHRHLGTSKKIRGSVGRKKTPW